MSRYQYGDGVVRPSVKRRVGGLGSWNPHGLAEVGSCGEPYRPHEREEQVCGRRAAPYLDVAATESTGHQVHVYRCDRHRPKG